ncbi:MAG: HAMP domain-containing histidine kinase [Clostridiales bacterium]|nr:HAMP domain-containing histidine kinase [Clostridiales bacterium]
MKKHYIRITIVICALILVAVLLGGLFFTYVQVNSVNDEFYDACHSDNEWFGLSFSDADLTLSDYVCNFCLSWEKYSRMRNNNVGYAGRFSWYDGDFHKLESQDFVRVYYLVNDEIQNSYQTRILLMDEDFGYGHTTELGQFAVNAMCDDVFLFDGFMTFQRNLQDETKTYFFKKPAQLTAQFGNTDDEWTSRHELYGAFYAMAENKAQAELNQEAKKKLAEVIKDDEFSKALDVCDRGWFSSYCLFSAGTDNRTPSVCVYDMFVYHPLSIVMARNGYVYLVFLVVLLALQAMVIFTMRKMYINRRNFEARSQKLARSVAHELKTPLAVTKAYVENWEYIDEDERAEVSEKINSEVDHMTKMVNSLLKLSKMDAGDVEIKPEEVEILSLTKSIFKRMEPLVAERELEVTWITDGKAAQATERGAADDAEQDEGAGATGGEGEYCVSADLEMMRIVIGNFLSNAVKFAKKNIKISVSKSAKSVRFSIINDGATIDPKDKKKIWDLFYKKDNARTDRLSSTGVGLAANKSILELHKAKYGVNCGAFETEFWFEMKRVKK